MHACIHTYIHNIVYNDIYNTTHIPISTKDASMERHFISTPEAK